jgi:hypothetical protein
MREGVNNSSCDSCHVEHLQPPFLAGTIVAVNHKEALTGWDLAAI